MRRILRLMLTAAGEYAPQFRRTLRLSVAASLVQAAAYAVFVPLLLELTRDPVRVGRAWLWVGVLAVLVMAEGTLRAREEAFTYNYWHLVTQATRLRLGAALRSMPQQELGRRAAGDLTTVVGGNTTAAAAAISSLSTVFIQMVTVPAVLGVFVLVLDWRLGLVLVAATVAAFPLVRQVQRRANAGLSEVNAADAQTSNRIVEYVQGLPVLKATGQAGSRSPLLRGVLTHQQHAQAKAQRAGALPLVGAQLIAQIALVVLAAVGTALTVHAHLSVTLLIAIVVCAARFAEPLGHAAIMTKLFEQSEAALRRVDEVLSIEPLATTAAKTLPATFDIRFDDVTFAYDGHAEPALAGVTFAVPERSLTALVGPSGSGKTTITKLICRYADPQRGSVHLGGIDLRNLHPDDLLRHIAVVFQDVYLFDDTVRANIALGRPDATDAELEEAARAANIHDFISALPDGYDTRVGEIGSALSGGERQRISIARAFLKDAPIVILDEPTAALDTESEVAVQQAMDRLVADRTVLVIAHRLSTIVGADQILVLDAGRIVQQGTHERLLAVEGRYARMWAAQTAAHDWQLVS